MSQVNQEKMYKLGLAMEEFRKFFWIGICFFYFIIPPFILLWKYIKFLFALNDVRLASPGKDNLKYGIFGLVIGIALSLVNATISYFFNDMALYLSGLQIICFIFGWIKLEQWSKYLYRERGTGCLAQFKDGMNDIKVAQILSIIIIGVFMMPAAFGKAGRALIKQYAPPKPAQYRQPQQSPTQSTERLLICPQCGDTVSSKNIRFCGTCGYEF